MRIFLFGCVSEVGAIDRQPTARTDVCNHKLTTIGSDINLLSISEVLILRAAVSLIGSVMVVRVPLISTLETIVILEVRGKTYAIKPLLILS